MIPRIKYFLLLLTYPFLLLPQVVENFEIAGNNAFKDSEVIGWSQVGKGTKIYEGILDTIKSRVTFNLSLKGYFNPSFEGTVMEFSEYQISCKRKHANFYKQSYLYKQRFTSS